MSEIIPILTPPDNYIWLLHDGISAVAVDPGAVTPLVDYLSAMNLTLTAILSTHHHTDHVAGNVSLVAQYGVPVYGPANEPIPALTHPLKGGERLTFEKPHLHCSVIAVPGHTMGHLAYFVEIPGGMAPPILFSGDTLFAGGCGRLFEGTPAQMLHALRRLAALPSNTRLCCGHEYTQSNLAFAAAVEPENPAIATRRTRVQIQRSCDLPSLPSLLSEEHDTNPYLRVQRPSVKNAVSDHVGRTLVDDIETFTWLRRWKDKW